MWHSKRKTNKKHIHCTNFIVNQLKIKKARDVLYENDDLTLLLLSLAMTRSAGHDTDLRLNSNISKTIRVKITFFKECLMRFIMISRLIDFALVVLQLLMFTICGISGNSKI